MKPIRQTTNQYRIFFCQNITVGKTFSYFIDKADTKFYKERIVILKKKDVEQYLKCRLMKIFFKSSCIYLIGKIAVT